MATLATIWKRSNDDGGSVRSGSRHSREWIRFALRALPNDDMLLLFEEDRQLAPGSPGRSGRARRMLVGRRRGGVLLMLGASIVAPHVAPRSAGYQLGIAEAGTPDAARSEARSRSAGSGSAEPRTPERYREGTQPDEPDVQSGHPSRQSQSRGQSGQQSDTNRARRQVTGEQAWKSGPLRRRESPPRFDGGDFVFVGDCNIRPADHAAGCGAREICQHRAETAGRADRDTRRRAALFSIAMASRSRSASPSIPFP